MPDGTTQTKRDSSAGGIASAHSAAVLPMILAAPSTDAQFNLVRLPLVTVGCWAVDDVRFAFDSSFVAADCSGGGGDPEDIRVELLALKTLVASNPGCPLSLFGHADPVGDDTYNKALSERRARAVYAVLIFQSEPDLAVKYWQSIAATESWGTDQRDTMRSFTGATTLSGSQLIRVYLQALSAPGPVLTKEDFLARGVDADRRGDFQGCSEFNPLLVFSQEKQQHYDEDKANGKTAERNSANAVNRRVLGLLYRKGTVVDPAVWPCPRASAGIAGCKIRFWADGDARRGTHISGADRKYNDKRDTFACRFYQRMAGSSPCESRTMRQFQYTLDARAGLPWPDDAQLVVSSEDGVTHYEFSVGAGKPTADSKLFVLFNVEAGVSYQAAIQSSELRLPLFGLTELYRVADPDDALKILAMPVYQPVAPDASADNSTGGDSEIPEALIDEQETAPLEHDVPASANASDFSADPKPLPTLGIA